MNDYPQMRRHLEALSEDDFIRFVGKLGSDILVLEDEVYETLNDPEEGGQRRLHPATWREKITEEMLACRENHPAEWNRICWVAKIDSDSAKQIVFSRSTRRMAFAAILISALSLGWQIVQLLMGGSE